MQHIYWNNCVSTQEQSQIFTWVYFTALDPVTIFSLCIHSQQPTNKNIQVNPHNPLQLLACISTADSQQLWSVKAPVRSVLFKSALDIWLENVTSSSFHP